MPTLDAYQVEGVQFLSDARRAILADDVGLGKTPQGIGACDKVRARRVLVVTKKSLIPQWLGEIQKFADPKQGYASTVFLANGAGDDVKARFVVTNYEALLKRQPTGPFDALVVDEAHRLKNRKAKRTVALKNLAGQVPYLFLLTATPIMNRPDELWSLLNIIDSRRYSSYWKFVDTYCSIVVTPWARQVVGARNLERLADELRPVLLRRTKAILSLPPKTRETIFVDMAPEQARMYSEMKRFFFTLTDDEQTILAPTTLAQLTRLRQITLTPALLGGRPDSGKTQALVELLEDYAEHHKVIVFTFFKEYAKHLAEALTAFNPAVIHGDLNDADRERNKVRFQTDPACRVLVGTIGTTSEGLNLQMSDLVVFTDKDWVPSTNEDQAEGRAHRRGQENPVHVISLVTQGTVDEYMEEALARKKTVAESVYHVVQRLKEGG